MLEKMDKAGESVPSYFGVNNEGKPTTVPGELLCGTLAPIGGHNGFGLAILGEILTGVLSGGQVIDEPHPVSGKTGVASQTAAVINPNMFMDPGHFEIRTTAIIKRMEAKAPELHVPGQYSNRIKRSFEATKIYSMEDSLYKVLNDWANRLDVYPLGEINS
jgi:LDH2 family malate/lactate/ureidoglycolate dehydrogenase